MNIILIVLDAFRRNLLDIFSNRRQSITPNLTRLAKKSLVFTDCYCNGFATDPNLTTIYTGLLPWQHGILNHGTSMTKHISEMCQKRKDFFLQNILKENGYTNCAVDLLGRWHKMGHHYYINPLETTNSLENYLYKGLWKYVPYKFLKNLRISKLLKNLRFTRGGKYKAEEVVKISESLIPKLESPFFLFLHFWDTHTPYLPPTDYEVQKPETSYNKKTRNVIERRHPKHKRFTELYAGDTTYTDEVVGKYHACAKYLDHQIGRLIDFLEENNILENSILIVTSDHGECFGEKNAFFAHHTHHQAVLRVPLLIYHPNRKSKKIKVRMQHADILPTLLDLLDIQDVNGNRLTKESVLKRKKDSVIYFGLTGNRTGFGRRFGVILGDYKYSRLLGESRFPTCKWCGVRHHQKKELYNIEKDPQEEKNMINDKERLKESLEKLIDEKNFRIKIEKERIKKTIQNIEEI